MGEFKKYKDFQPIIKEDQEIIIENLEFLDEAILADIKKFGVWNSIKRLGNRILIGINDIIKANPKIKSMISDGVKSYGKEFAEDTTQILGEYEKEWQKKEAEWKKKEEEWKKKEREYERSK